MYSLIEQWHNFWDYGCKGSAILDAYAEQYKTIHKQEQDLLELQLLLENEVIKRKEAEKQLVDEIYKASLITRENFDHPKIAALEKELEFKASQIEHYIEVFNEQLARANKYAEKLDDAEKEKGTYRAHIDSLNNHISKTEALLENEHDEFESYKSTTYNEHLENLQETNHLIENLRNEIDSLTDKLAKSATQHMYSQKECQSLREALVEEQKNYGLLFNKETEANHLIKDLQQQVKRQEIDDNDIVIALKNKYAALAEEHDYCLRFGEATVKSIIKQRDELLHEKRKREEDERYAPLKQVRRK